MVELVLWVGNQPRQKIFVKRYDCLLELDSNGVALSQADFPRMSDSKHCAESRSSALDWTTFLKPPVEFVQMESEGVPSGRWFPRTMVTDSKALFVYPAAR